MLYQAIVFLPAFAHPISCSPSSPLPLRQSLLPPATLTLTRMSRSTPRSRVNVYHSPTTITTTSSSRNNSRSLQVLPDFRASAAYLSSIGASLNLRTDKSQTIEQSLTASISAHESSTGFTTTMPSIEQPSAKELPIVRFSQPLPVVRLPPRTPTTQGEPRTPKILCKTFVLSCGSPSSLPLPALSPAQRPRPVVKLPSPENYPPNNQGMPQPKTADALLNVKVKTTHSSTRDATDATDSYRQPLKRLDHNPPKGKRPEPRIAEGEMSEMKKDIQKLVGTEINTEAMVANTRPPSAGRPEKTDLVLRRMIAGHLGIRIPKRTDERSMEIDREIRR
jgi:hypothetical protein